MTTATTLARLGEAGVVAVVRAPDRVGALRAVDALLAGGIRAIEITFTTPDAAGVIASLSDRTEAGFVLGAGTVLTAHQAEEAAAAGASFIVTPGTTPALAAAVTATRTAAIFGAYTPTEVIRVLELGADAVKVFPASLGGPRYLAALRAPFPDLVVMPTGGVTAENLGDWFAAGAFCVGAGGELCSGTLIAQGQWDEIERRAKAFAGAVARLRA